MFCCVNFIWCFTRNSNYNPFGHYQEAKGRTNERWRLILKIGEA